MPVHGKEYLCAVKYSASFLGEPLHRVTTGVAKVLQSTPQSLRQLGGHGAGRE
jgi:hypothetical protein